MEYYGKTKNILILASGNGSNFEAIVKYFNKKDLYYKKLNNNNNNNNEQKKESIYKLNFFLISENKDAYVLIRAKRLNISSMIIEWDKNDRSKFFKKLDEFCNKFEPELIILAGFMKIIPDFFIRKYYPKIINIHPSLLPAFKGLNAIKKAYKYGVKYTGITIHYVNEGVDTGPIIDQFAFRINKNDNLEKIEQKIHKLEHKNYSKVIENILFCNEEE